MAELYRMSEVVVSVPISDGTPVSVLEAMACGKPVICTDLPSLREFITNGENGWLIPVRQTAPLAETIIRLLDQPDLARDLGLKANQVVAEKANYEVEMQRMESIYDRIAGSTRR
jgi:glycosyltransferase involved in cell wall biosynthesis